MDKFTHLRVQKEEVLSTNLGVLGVPAQHCRGTDEKLPTATVPAGHGLPAPPWRFLLYTQRATKRPRRRRRKQSTTAAATTPGNRAVSVETEAEQRVVGVGQSRTSLWAGWGLWDGVPGSSVPLGCTHHAWTLLCHFHAETSPHQSSP